MEVIMVNGIIAEDGTLITDEMIANWESALERDEWPEGWRNVGEIVEGKLPSSMNDSVTLSIKIPAAMKRVLETEAEHEGKTTSAYVRGVLANSLMASA
jgi:predicted GNAT superfamily acetyltransferase